MALVTNMAIETANQRTFLAMTRIYDAVDGVGSFCDLDLGRCRSSPNVQRMPDVPCYSYKFFSPPFLFDTFFLKESLMDYRRTTITVAMAV